ncbi:MULTISPECIES: mannose-1-phosphate guanylyltransferase/mannose-6-phosphate isomerase [unclassified Pseudoalteromonas]|uniref:mannose-1-phosphate guanylyltransferase/mannose-6-phosphate isomerase n=1 Tax=unclassified Pseudoalteromonas TaxID=194690 RepID=UPI001109246C|nr:MULTISPECIES: mannose-1-phosphate guanylyltransferase/mannose-6-phosphate isomerase [unclassified Pseudoalteromonas]MBW4967823.1 mannose-1-phosphate guanylyltransferase/mannose-6-phosphate isomerase [Pseudoalteromonas sp. CR1]TMN77579.1 mannose-1-phosphate guanylyltransferase/mannose-6-phosphate isomerase [Pseudoalteromonas sp. S410]TMN90935.1 mannose-1-phosphate guanylyltransferase/mannose-6-phosphate isomerase [Pseudoalteromonas sp. S408]TMN94914.1 mannose-1-phosphate guanylyltransferase/m|tara:strand:+ start:640 stop:2061 length:1422 start_codon:yes stop_codon:yes gene_type:complete
MNTLITPVILAGGIGSRLWPLSRQAMPKQFLPLLDNHYSLLQSTLARVSGNQFEKPILVCNEQHRFIAAEQSTIINPQALLLEPQGKNTAPAIALAACYALQQGIDGPMLVMPADHYIENFDELTLQLNDAVKLAEQGMLVTFSITPTHAHTGFGYIKQGSKISGSNCFEVAEFKEKPTLATAQKYLAEGGYSWNSGMFLFTPRAYLNELERFAPKIAHSVHAASQFSHDLGFTRPNIEPLKSCPSDSIDYAILERSNNVAVMPVALKWSDVGSFSALASLTKQDAHGNNENQNHIAQNSTNNFVISEHDHSIATLGVSDLAIIHTHDATLVADKNKLDGLPLLLKQLAQGQSDKLNHHQVVYRPWGNYRTLVEDSGFKVKKITVNSGAKLSTQQHQHRAEHWVVVSGIANVRIDEQLLTLTQDQSCYIAAKQVHSLANNQQVPLIVIEVQTGAILDESDIQRFDDLYGREGL